MRNPLYGAREHEKKKKISMEKSTIRKIVEKMTEMKIIKKIDDRKINNFPIGGSGVRCRKPRCEKKVAVCALLFAAAALSFISCTKKLPVQTLTLTRADGSTVSVRYALEVPQGWFKRVNIKVGDTLVLDFDMHAE